VNVIKCTKINLPDKVFTSNTVTIPSGKDMDRLCLNAQCSLITTITWPTPYFYHFFDDKIFVTVDKRPVFLQNTSGNPSRIAYQSITLGNRFHVIYSSLVL